jgi:hypothetical protein
MSFYIFAAHLHAYIAVLLFHFADMQAPYPPDVAPPLEQDAPVPVEDWDVLFRAVLERLCAAVASERVDASVRACVHDCVDALDLLRHSWPGARSGHAP